MAGGGGVVFPLLVELQTKLRVGGDDGLNGDDQGPYVARWPEKLPGYHGGPPCILINSFFLNMEATMILFSFGSS